MTIKKFNLFNEGKKSNIDIADKLMEIENNCREELGIKSSDPVWNNKNIRKKYINYLDKELGKLDLDMIEDNSKEIKEILNDEGYNLLIHFLVMREYINDKSLYRYILRKIKTPVPTDMDKEFISAILDFMN